MSARARRVMVGALTGTGVALAALTGCGAGDQLSERASEKVVEKAVEAGASGDVEVDLDGEKLKVESSDGSFSMGGDVPADFPSEVPLADGKVAMAASTGDGWSVVMEVDGAFVEVSEVVFESITRAGFEETTRTSSQDYAALMAGNDTYDVMVTAAPGDAGGTMLSYAVTPAS